MRWYPFDWESYRLDTRHLTTLEHGAYRLLLDEYYATRRPLPDNDRALARIVGLTDPEWLEISQAVRAFFIPKLGKLHHRRCDQELDAQDRRSMRRTERARKAAITRHNKDNDLDATSMLQACSEHATSMLGDATVDKEKNRVTSHSDPPPPLSESPHFKKPLAREQKAKANGADEDFSLEALEGADR